MLSPSFLPAKKKKKTENPFIHHILFIPAYHHLDLAPTQKTIKNRDSHAHHAYIHVLPLSPNYTTIIHHLFIFTPLYSKTTPFTHYHLNIPASIQPASRTHHQKTESHTFFVINRNHPLLLLQPHPSNLPSYWTGPHSSTKPSSLILPNQPHPNITERWTKEWKPSPAASRSFKRKTHTNGSGPRCSREEGEWKSHILGSHRRGPWWTSPSPAASLAGCGGVAISRG